MNVFAFDIETIPDVRTGRRLYRLDGLSDAHVAEVMFQKQRQASGSEFLRHHLQRIVAISVALRTGDRFKVWSLGDKDASERELIERFFDGIDRYSPTLVSWNGGGFDLMDVLAAYQARAVAPLDEIATLLGLPGKLGMDGSKVWPCYQAGELGSIRNYCETDVLNTYLIYLRFELMRGRLNEDAYNFECEVVRETLGREDKPHLHEFLRAWAEGR